MSTGELAPKKPAAEALRSLGSGSELATAAPPENRPDPPQADAPQADTPQADAPQAGDLHADEHTDGRREFDNRPDESGSPAPISREFFGPDSPTASGWTNYGVTGGAGAHPLMAHLDIVPEQLGPWRICNLLGRGGMGEVWRAERSDGMFDMSVAIKIMRGDRRDVVERFTTERRVLAQLDHPGIARLLDGGVTDTNLPYLVTEYIEGENIDRWCDRQNSGLKSRLQLFLQICDAVSYAHSELVVHRDLKPGNILIDVDGSAKLLDFGIAKLMQDQHPDEATDESPHTPEYAAPEQVQGGAITVRTDVYALGLLLYYLLTGLKPQARSGALADQVERILNRNPEAASVACEKFASKRIRALVPPEKLAGDLDAIIQQAIRKSPAARYASVEALAKDIRAHLENRPIEARPWGRFEHLSAYMRRNGRLALLSSSALLGGLMLIGFGIYQAGLARASQSALASQAQQADRREKETLAARIFIASWMKDLTVQGSAGSSMASSARRYAQSTLGEFPELQSGVMWEIAGTYSNFKMYSERQMMLESNYQRIRERHRLLSLDTQANPEFLAQLQAGRAVSACQFAAALGELEQRIATQKLLAEADELIESLPNQIPLGWARLDCSRIGGRALRFIGQFEAAESRIAQGLEIMRKRYATNGENHHSQYADMLNGYAVAQLQAGHFSAAIKTLNELIELLTSQGREQSNPMSNALTNLAASQRALGGLEDAKRNYQRALALQRLRSEELISPIIHCGLLQTELERRTASKTEIAALITTCERQVEQDDGSPRFNARSCWAILMQAARLQADGELAARARARLESHSLGLSAEVRAQDIPTLALKLQDLQFRNQVTLRTLQPFLALNAERFPSQIQLKSQALSLAGQLNLSEGHPLQARQIQAELRRLWRGELGDQAELDQHPTQQPLALALARQP